MWLLRADHMVMAYYNVYTTVPCSHDGVSAYMSIAWYVNQGGYN